MRTENLKIVITGGGSGGHLNAAIAVIKEIEKSHPEVFEQLLFIGGKRGMINDPTPSIESRKIPELGVRFEAIRSGKLHRKFNLTTLKLLSGVWGGYKDAYRILRKEKPDIVFSSGGYVTVPVAAAAWMLKIPVVIHEQTIVSGLANRIAARFAKKILVSFPNSLKEFPKSKTIVTGAPIQESRLLDSLPGSIDPQYRKILEKFVDNKSQKPFLFITGGGLGSHVINQWVLSNLDKLAEKFNVLIQTGENQFHNDYEKIIQAIEDKNLEESIKAIKWFGDEIGYIYTYADVVLCRPGANTVIELLLKNRKAVMIPIPWSSGHEQQLNAEFFIKHQAGMIVHQKNIEKDLWNALIEVVSKPQQDSSKIIPIDAAKKIVEILISELSL